MVVRPFDESGIARDGSGVKRCVELPDSVVALLQASVERDPHGEAVVELDGPRVSYEQLWDRSARVAGGLHATGVARGDRVAIRLGNGADRCWPSSVETDDVTDRPKPLPTRAFGKACLIDCTRSGAIGAPP